MTKKSKKWKYPTKPFLHDNGHLVVRGLAPRRYVGIRIPGFRSFHGENTERVCTQYDAVVAGEYKDRAGLRKKPKRIQSAKKHEETGARQKREKNKAEVLADTRKLQTQWITRKWV